MLNGKAILEGHLKELIGSNDNLSESRLEICRNCKVYLYDNVFGPLCNNKIWIDENDNISTKPLDGYKRGCGCRLRAKTRLTNSKCIIGKW